MSRLIFLVILCASFGITPAVAAEYATARMLTPVMNTPDLKAVFGGAGSRNLKVDRCGQVRELEYIALPGTLFSLLKKVSTGKNEVYQVATDEYTPPPAVRLYVDGRFLTRGLSAPLPRRRSLPSPEEITSSLRSAVGAPYVWGGNALDGVPELTDLFFTGIAGGDRRGRMLAGLDCSGLLYFATGGWTPRNSSQLISYGRGIAVAGKKSAEIANLLQPFDLIAWNGHVIVVLDRQTTIESRLACKAGNGGVVLTPLPQRIAEIMRTRRPVNVWPEGKKDGDIFVVRRWYAP